MKYLAFLLVIFGPLAAQEADLGVQLREALFTEEVKRDADAAARQYEDMLTRFGEQRAFASTALFRLAEVRRKQDRKDDAVALYQRLLREFSDFETEANLARENLAALGAKSPEPGSSIDDEEWAELARLTKLAETSPDLLRDPKLLVTAAGKNQIRVLRFLLDQGVDPNALVAGPVDGMNQSALATAARRGHLSVCRLLLEEGADPNFDMGATERPGLNHSPLFQAASANHLEVIALLLKHTADPDFFGTRADYPDQEKGAGPKPGGSKVAGLWTATALFLALEDGRWEAAKLLIEAGADVGLGDRVSGLAPLHLAARKGNAEWVKRLLEGGANPNAGTTPPELVSNKASYRVGRGTTPLLLAVNSGSVECVRLLLAAGKSDQAVSALARAVELNSKELVEVLLDSGVDPNALVPHGRPVLVSAFGPDHGEMLKLLLKRGADPNLQYGRLELDLGQGCDDPFAETPGEILETTVSLLWDASARSKNLPAMKILLDAGARPGPGLAFLIQSVARWDEDGSVVAKLLEFRPDRFNLEEIPAMGDWKPAARRVFLQEAVYPVLAAKPEIGFLFVHYGQTKPLARKEGSAEPPSLAQLLFDDLKFVSEPNAITGNTDKQRSELTLVRADGPGAWSEQKLDLVGDEPFPDLQWGDLIVAEPSPDRDDPFAPSTDSVRESMEWSFRKRVSFPVTLEVDGKVREVRLKGGLLVFDPTRNEAPWVEATQLVSLLVPTPDRAPHRAVGSQDVSVRRAGWDEIRLIVEGKKISRLTLQPGDRVVVTSREEEGRPWRAVVTVPGFPFVRSFGSETYNNPSDIISHLASYPTLVQAIADIYAPWSRSQTPTRKGGLNLFIADLAKKQVDHRLSYPSIPPHPNFGGIRILRFDRHGGESIVEVNLAEAIARCTDETPGEQVREADIPLRPGDIVEIPLHEDRLGQEWPGFSPSEVRFFQKALGGRIQYVPSGSEQQLIELSWQPTRWEASRAGSLPLPPERGVSSMRANRILTDSTVGNLEVGRDGKLLRETFRSQVFVRDRDQIYPAKARGIRLLPPKSR